MLFLNKKLNKKEMGCLYRMLYIEGENMNKEIVIDAINLVRKYKSETSTIEIKSAAKGFPRGATTHFLVFQIEMVV